MSADLDNSDERRQMRRTVADFLGRNADAAHLRAVIGASDGLDRTLWARTADELGLHAVLIPESAGGLGLGFGEAALVLTEFGRRLVPGPLIDTYVSTAVLARCGTDAGQELLGRVAAEGLSCAVAVAEEGTGWTDRPAAVRAEPVPGDSADRWELHGDKVLVVHGGAADVLLVSAAVPAGPAGEPGLFAVPPDAAGLTRTDQQGLDHTRRYARISLDGVRATRLDAPGSGAVRLLIDVMLVALAVDSVAAARQCLESTVEYLKVRHQFGRALGSFQALKHRCADLAVELAGAEATAWYAVQTVIEESAELALLAPLAKAVCADALLAVAAEGIQLHGGIGFTFEHDAHLYFKHAKANQQLFGSSAHLRRDVGRLAGI